MRENGNSSGKAGRRAEQGQAAVEMALFIPLLLVLWFSAFQLARLFYVYHTLHKALRGGAGLVARASNINYCNLADPVLTDIRNFVVFGNLQGAGDPVVRGLTPDLIQILPERTVTDSTVVTECLCTEEPDSCDIQAGGRPADFVVVSLGDGFPVEVPFPYVTLGTINLKVSVRMPVTGG